MSWKLTVRAGPRVERSRHESADAALAELEGRGRELAASADGRTVKNPLGPDYEPVQRVVARLELAGPKRVRVGVDVRGDGSAEAWSGRFSREVVEQERGESAYDSLRRKLSS